MNLSFAGCGFLGIYHVGVAVCFKKYAPHLLLHKISGASAGALAACCLLCDMPLGEMTSDFFRVVNEARKHSLGPFSPKFNIQTSLLEGLQKFLPVDAHLRVNGRLHISLTRVYDGKSVIVSQFNSREDLLQALLCACFIPVFSGLLPPRFHGVRYMDGAFSDNLPILDENTVTVSPFSGESDICPRDQSTQLFHVNWANTSIEVSKQNINRFGRILFPPKPEVLSNMCQQGFDDALRFLHRNNLISCTRCLSVQSTFIVSEATVPEVQEYDPECKECTEHRKEAKNGNMPDTVLTVFQTYIDSANKGLANWIFRHRSAKLIHALSLPATLPADFVCATLTNLVGDTVEKRDYQFKVIANALHARNSHCSVHGKKSPLDYRHYEKEIRRLLMAAPSLGNQIWHVSKYVLSQLNSALIPRKQKQKLAADLSYQLALTEYGEKLPYTNNNTNNCTDNHKIDIIMDDSPISGNELVPSKCKNINQLNSGGEDDTFEHILQVTSHQEAVYAYYYLDENNKVKVTEIFDMTENDNPSLQTANERETNQQLQFDTDWDVEQPDFMFDGMSDPYYDNIIDNYHNTTIEYDDDEDFTFDLYNNTSKNCKDTKMITNYEHQKLTIEDITHHDDDENYLQPEVDQTTNLFSESISNLLTKPIPHSTISFD